MLDLNVLEDETLLPTNQIQYFIEEFKKLTIEEKRNLAEDPQFIKWVIKYQDEILDYHE